MQKLYFKDFLIGSFSTEEEMKALKESFKKDLVNKILELDELAKELYEKREVDTNKEYLEFLKKINPTFVDKMDEIKNIVFKEEFIEYCFLGKSISTISMKIKDESKKRGVNFYNFSNIFMGLATDKYDIYFHIK